MPNKVYKRTNVSRSVASQDQGLAKIFPDYADAPTYFDGDRDMLTRPSTRKEQDTIYCASLALFADVEWDLHVFLKDCKTRNIILICAEENLTWSGDKPINIVAKLWREARKTGAAKRGAEMAAASKKEKTATKMKLIEEELKRPSGPGNTTRELLKRVGVKSVNSIKNHFGITREKMQIRYQAELKRKARRKANA